MIRCETSVKDNKNSLKLMLKYDSIGSLDMEPVNRRFTMKYLPLTSMSLFRLLVENTTT